MFRNSSIKQKQETEMKLIAKLLGTKKKFRIKEIKVGVKSRYQIQSSGLGLIWSTVINPLIVNPADTPYEFKNLAEAEKKKLQLQSSIQ